MMRLPWFPAWSGATWLTRPLNTGVGVRAGCDAAKRTCDTEVPRTGKASDLACGRRICDHVAENLGAVPLGTGREDTTHA